MTKKKFAEIKINTLADVESIQWAGNFHDDCKKFEAVSNFIMTANREEAKQALFLMNSEGMGIEGEVTDDILDEYKDQIISGTS